MKPSMLKKLNMLLDRSEQLKILLSDPSIIHDQNRFRDLSKEFAQLEPIVKIYSAFQAAANEMTEVDALLKEEDIELRQLAKQETKRLGDYLNDVEIQLTTSLLPNDPNDKNNVFLEIRAGAGGNEAAIFAGNLSRMYMRYAENQRWKVEILSESQGEHGGYKEIILRIAGQAVYSELKFESGVHRVQRVPETEAQGRIHTSTCTVAVLPEFEEIDDIEINPADLRTDTFRASGAGGQHVQKTDSAIRITHIPTGTVVECQDERSQHKNRARAMSLLKAKILQAEQQKQQQQQADTRRNLVGTGDRSERIRTYNYPQGRLTDHRINLTLYQLTSILEGELMPIIHALQHEHRADLLAAFGD